MTKGTAAKALGAMQIGFIGAGNMAQSLIGGLLDDGLAPGQLWASDPSEACRDILAARGVNVGTDNGRLLEQADIVMLAVKPQLMQQVVEPLAAQLQAMPAAARPLFISIAAGVSQASLVRWLVGTDIGANSAAGDGAEPIAVVRCMPNTPALVGSGATGMYANAAVSSVQHAAAEALLSAVGLVVWVESEAAIDSVTALSGSGPAYFFYVIEAMIDKAIALGLDPTTATQLAQQTALGAAQMCIESDVDAAELRRRVTSPNGTTEAALQGFADGGLADTIAEGMQRAVQRAQELEQELGA